MKESDIQSDIMTALSENPNVVWCLVTTNGKARVNGYWVTLGSIPGLSDIIGQLRTGQAFGIEVKVPGQTPTDDQWDFINLGNKNGGEYGWADSVESALEVIE